MEVVKVEVEEEEERCSPSRKSWVAADALHQTLRLLEHHHNFLRKCSESSTVNRRK